MGECRDCAYSDRPIYKWPCDVCRATKNGRSMYCPEEADHIANYEWITDYISLCEAQDAMTAENLIRNLDQVENGEAKRYARAAIRVLERLKPANVRPVKWIPVTERLPEETGFYLVWMLWPHDETHVHAIINYDADCEAFGEWEEYYDPVSLGWAGSDFIKIENVYAWMPLPEPPMIEK